MNTNTGKETNCFFIVPGADAQSGPFPSGQKTTIEGKSRRIDN